MDGLEEGLRDLKRREIQQKNQKFLLIWTLIGSQNLNHQLKNEHMLDPRHMWQLSYLFFVLVFQQLEWGSFPVHIA